MFAEHLVKGGLAVSPILAGTLLLTATGLFSQVVGFFYRIALSRLIGAETMGLYQLVFTVYGLAVALATSGVSVAAARMTAEQLGQSKRRTLLER